MSQFDAHHYFHETVANREYYGPVLRSLTRAQELIENSTMFITHCDGRMDEVCEFVDLALEQIAEIKKILWNVQLPAKVLKELEEKKRKEEKTAWV